MSNLHALRAIIFTAVLAVCFLLFSCVTTVTEALAQEPDEIRQTAEEITTEIGGYFIDLFGGGSGSESQADRDFREEAAKVGADNEARLAILLDQGYAPDLCFTRGVGPEMPISCFQPLKDGAEDVIRQIESIIADLEDAADKAGVELK